jgi:O-antigen/teichoic acid export membrane protein
MSEASKIRKNSLFSLLSISSRLITNSVVFLIVARNYDENIFGQFTFAHTLATILIVFADFGLDILLVTEISKSQNDRVDIFNKYFGYKIVFSILASASIFLVTTIGSITYNAKILAYVFSSFVIFSSLTNFLYALFKGMEQFKYETINTFITNVFLFVLIIILSLFKISILIIAITFVLSRLLSLILAFLKARKILPGIKIKFDLSTWKRENKKIVVFGLQLIFAYLLFYIDTILLAFWSNDYNVGIYQSVIKLVALVLVIPDVLINSLLPVLSRLYVENKNQWFRLSSLLCRILILIVLPIVFFIIVYSNKIIEIIYGPNKFIEAIPIFRIFAIIIFIRFAVESFALMLTTSNKQNIRMIIVIAGTFVNMAINYIFIPKYGAMGATIVAFITNSVVGIGFVYFNYKLFLQAIINYKIILPVFFLCSVYIILYNLENIPVLVSILLITVMYFILIVRYSFTRDEVILLVNKKYSFVINMFLFLNNSKANNE